MIGDPANGSNGELGAGEVKDRYKQRELSPQERLVLEREFHMSSGDDDDGEPAAK